MATSDHEDPLMELGTSDKINATGNFDGIVSSIVRDPISDDICANLNQDAACQSKTAGMVQNVVSDPFSDDIQDAQQQSNAASTEGIEKELSRDIHTGEFHDAMNNGNRESKLVDEVMHMVTIPSIAPDVVLIKGNDMIQDKETYTDDFDSDTSSADETSAKDKLKKPKLLNLPLEVVATDSEMELGTSDQEEPLLDLSPGPHGLETQRSDNSGTEDAEQFVGGLKKESVHVSSPRSACKTGKKFIDLANGTHTSVRNKANPSDRE